MNPTAKSRRLRAPQGASVDEELSSIWSDVRAKPVRRRVIAVAPTSSPIAPVEPVIRWSLTFHEGDELAVGTRPAFMVVPGATAHDRMGFYRKYLAPEWKTFRPDTIEDIIGDDARDWVDETIIGNLTRRIANAKIPEGATKTLPAWFPPPGHGWELLWALVSNDVFVIEEPLRQMVDRGGLVHHFYKALWDFRFALKENESFEPAARVYFAITRWMTGLELGDDDIRVLEKIGVGRRVSSVAERFDLLFFLVTLCAQNGLLNRMVLCFDGLERALQSSHRPVLRELDMFLGALERWVKFTQTPVGVLVGFGASEREKSQLRKLNPKLADRIVAGLAWTKTA